MAQRMLARRMFNTVISSIEPMLYAFEKNKQNQKIIELQQYVDEVVRQNKLLNHTVTKNNEILNKIMEQKKNKKNKNIYKRFNKPAC